MRAAAAGSGIIRSYGAIGSAAVQQALNRQQQGRFPAA